LKGSIFPIFLTIMFRTFNLLAPKGFCIIWLINIMTLSVLDKNYSRNTPRPLNKMSTWLSLGRYIGWRTISPCGYHQLSSQCFSTDLSYYLCTKLAIYVVLVSLFLGS